MHETLNNGGKILIPVFALGRAQELCVLLENYWKRTGLTYPIYFSGGLTEKANFYYKLFTNWTNEHIKTQFITKGENIFDFKFVKPFDWNIVNLNTPMVLFATPGMMNAGTSLEVFKQWAPEPKNLVIFPGYCSPGTVGNKVLKGEKKIIIDNKTVHVNC